jgi:hypothetical protein
MKLRRVTCQLQELIQTNNVKRAKENYETLTAINFQQKKTG